MPNLYELTDQYRTLEEAAYNDELSYEEFDQLLMQIEGDIEEKVNGYGCLLRGIAGDVKKLSAEEYRLKLRRKSLEKRMERIKAALADNMDAQGRRNVKTALFTIYFSKHNRLEITDLNGVPEEYIKPRTIKEDDVNKTAIKAYIEETGEILPYAHLVADRSLNIR